MPAGCVGGCWSHPAAEGGDVPADQELGAVDWLFDPEATKTGDTTRVPFPHGARVAAMTRWSSALGGVTSKDAEVGQEVSVPTGTSEYPTLK